MSKLDFKVAPIKVSPMQLKVGRCSLDPISHGDATHRITVREAGVLRRVFNACAECAKGYEND